MSDDRVQVFGLLMNCPYTMDNSDKSCPLYKIRKEYVDVEDRLEFVQSLSAEAVSQIIITHRDCHKVKEWRQ